MQSPPLAPADSPPFPVGAILRHYKGGLYQVTGFCRIEATLETGVLYRPMQGDQDVPWMRPRKEFGDPVETGSGTVTRFTLVDA